MPFSFISMTISGAGFLQNVLVSPVYCGQLLVGDRGGFDPSRSTKSPHHGRTGVPTITKLPRNPLRGPAQSSMDEYAAHSSNKDMGTYQAQRFAAVVVVVVV